MIRPVLFMSHPVAPTAEELVNHPTPFAAAICVDANIKRALRWLAWLRKTFPAVTFIAPWIASVLSGEDDADPATREAGLVDCEAAVAHCDGVVMVGGRVSSGMERERAVTIDCGIECVDLTYLGDEPPDLGGDGYDFARLVSDGMRIVAVGRRAA